VADLGSPAAHERALRDAFEAAVGARLRSTGAVGAMTSGGLDSSSSAATAATLLAPEPLHTYTSAPPPGWKVGQRPGWDADESPLVRELAALHPNMQPAFVHVEPGGSLFALHEPLWELGSGPVRNPCNALWMHAIQVRAGSEGVAVLLSGGRGNLCFSADGPDWLRTLVREGKIGGALREAKAWSRASGEGLVRTLLAQLAYPPLPAPMRRLVQRLAGRPDATAIWIANFALREKVLAGYDLLSGVPALIDRRGAHQRVIALRVAQAGAAQADGVAATAALTGAEERDPTLDRRVLEVAMRQPEWVRRHDGISRAVVRGAMADLLPPGIVNRTARGEQLPDWLDLMTAARAEIASELDELVEHPTSRELIDTNRLRALVERWPSRDLRADGRVARNYRLALLRALHVSRYLRWFERRAAAP
jgi:asparagine synthase (glutamine-hydrolysing)